MLSLHNIDPASGGVQTKPAMNLKITLQTLRRIERLLDGWQSSGDIPAIERDLACDLLRRAYDDIFFSDRDAATAPEASLAENTPADRTNEKAVGEVPDTVAGTTVAAGDALVAEVASPVGLAGLAPSVETAEGRPEESPENAEAIAEPAAEPAPMEVPAEVPAEEDASAEMPVDASVSVEESVEEPAAVGEPVEEDHPVAMPVGEVAEEEIPVEEFGAAGEPGEAVEQSGEAGETGDAVEEPDDAVSPAEDVATSIPEPSVDIVIDPVFEVFTDEDEDAEVPDGTEKTEEAAAVNLAETVNVVDAVEAVGAADDTEIAEEMEEMEEMEVVEETDAEEPEIGHPAADPAAMQPVASTAAPAAPAAEPRPESVWASAPAESSTEETRTDAAASTAETLEEMAARFKNASGRRRKSRRAFLSLYDDDETFRRGALNDQLELSDWGIEPSDTSAKLRHTRELFGLPADDPDTTPEPTPQPAADAAVDANVNAADGEVEVEVFDFVGDDDLEQSDQTAEPAAESPVKPATEPTSEPMSEPASEPTAVPIEPASCPTAAPAREERDDADDDLPFDEAIVALDDSDDASDSDDAPSVLPSLEPLGSPEHSELSEPSEPSEPSEFPDAVPFDSIEIADPAASATEPAAVRGLYDRGEEPELPASTAVLGEVMGHDVPTVGDSLGHRPDVAGWAEVSDDLNRAISVGDRFVLLRDLFDGDQALCDRTLKRLSTFDDLDDCMIWITENFAWNANSEGAKLIMGLLERKLG